MVRKVAAMMIQITKTIKVAIRKWKLSTARLHLQQTDGFTLTEALATVIVVGLVSAGLATAVTVGSQQFSRSMAMSESRVLCSIIEQDMKNDLTYATNIVWGEKSADKPNSYAVKGYESSHSSSEQPLYLKTLSQDGKQVTSPVSTDSGEETLTGIGQLALCSADNVQVRARLVSSKAYNYGLKACVKSITYNVEKKRFTVSLVITTQDDLSNNLIDENFTVNALNSPGVNSPWA